MGRGIFFQCESCGQRAFNDFPLTWIHISSFSLQVQKGRWCERDLSYEHDYTSYLNLAFCSFQCFFDWCVKKYPDACPNLTNPSQR